MKIVLDGMGGDYAPLESVKGAVHAVQENQELELIITGDKQVIKRELSKYGNFPRISIINTSDVITMNDHPGEALLKKKNSSLYKAIELVKSGEAKGIVSAGNTGAQMAISMFVLGRLPNVTRPAIGIPVPCPNSMGLLLDSGANAEVAVREYLVFALLGKVYLSNILKRPVTIGLLNIGAEEEKGSKLTREAYKLLKDNFPEFKGNIEANEILKGKVDVIVTDGFTGNIALKAIEGTVEVLVENLKNESLKTFKGKMGGLLLKPTLKKIFKRFDYENFGGSPLLGVQGVSIIAHGRSKHTAIKNAIGVAFNMANGGVIDELVSELKTERYSTR